MAKVIISGVPAANGEYPLDLSYFTNRELHLIKKEAGVRAGEFDDAIAAGDSDLIVAVALIALARNGKGDVPTSVLWDAQVGSIALDVSDEEPEPSPETATAEDDALPPESEPAAPAGDGGN